MKKTYISPETERLDMDMLSLLAGSVKEGGNNKNNEELISAPDEVGAKEGNIFSGWE